MQTRAERVLAVGGALAIAALLAACGSSSGSGSAGDGGSANARAGGVSEAKRLVTKAQAAPSGFRAPGPAFDASKASGKLLWVVEYSTSSSPTIALWDKTLTEAVKPYGVKVSIFDGKGEVSEFLRGIQQGIASHAGAILIDGVEPTSVTGPLKAAKAAGIPVMVSSTGLPELPTGPPGLDAVVSLDHRIVGKTLADWMVADSGGNADTDIVTHQGVVGTDVIVNNITQEMHRLCPSCRVHTVNLPFSRISQEGALTQSLIVKDPQLDYIVPVYDFETLAMASAVGQAGAVNRVKLASFNALPAVMSELAKGSPIQADVGNPNIWYGYALADQALRLLTGTKPVADENVPLRFFTRENIGSVNLKAGEEGWYGTVDYRQEYQKLWSGGQ